MVKALRLGRLRSRNLIEPSDRHSKTYQLVISQICHPKGKTKNTIIHINKTAIPAKRLKKTKHTLSIKYCIQNYAPFMENTRFTFAINYILVIY